MKKVFFLLFTLNFLSVNAQSWQWGREAIPRPPGGGDAGGDHCVAVDLLGNASFTGQFWDTVSFGTVTLRSQNGSAYIVKYKANGVLQWAQQAIQRSGFSIGMGISLDPSDNLFVTGSFNDTTYFGSCALNFTDRATNMFLVKYAPNGNAIWAKQAALASDACQCYGYGVSEDNSGNSYVIGYFRDTVSFGANTLVSNSTGSMYIAKFDPNGNVLWAKQANPASAACTISVSSISIGPAGDIYATGYFADTVSFGPFIVRNAGANLSTDMFLTKYDNNGNVIWVKQTMIASLASAGTGSSVSVDGIGNIYVTGNFKDTVTFGSSVLISSLDNIFLAKYNPGGNVLWVHKANILDNNIWNSYSVISDTLSQDGGCLLLTGSSTPPYKIEFGSDTFRLNSIRQTTTLLLKFDSTGRTQCGTLFTEGDEEDGAGIGMDHSGQYVYVSGDLQNTAIFGVDTLVYGSDDPFLASWQPCSLIDVINNLPLQTRIVKFYPNPNDGRFNIELETIDEKYNLEIFNMLGENIYSSRLSAYTTQVDLNHLSSGIYLYRILMENGHLLSGGKFIIQK